MADTQPQTRRPWWKFWLPRRSSAELEIKEERYSALVALVTAGVLVVVVLGLLVVLLLGLSRWGAEDSGPEAALSLVFVAAVVVLILVMCTLSIVFRRLGVYDEYEAMGLPRGSVRAVIALLLIMLFFISAVFLFNSTKNGSDDESRTLENVTEEQYQAIPPDDIQSAVRDAESDTYTVVRTANTSTSNDIAKQLVTTVATLVTAVAAFYFGANSVTTAAKEARMDDRDGGGEGGRRKGPKKDPDGPGGGTDKTAEPEPAGAGKPAAKRASKAPTRSTQRGAATRAPDRR